MRFIVWRKKRTTQENATTQETTQEIPGRILALVAANPKMTTAKITAYVGQ